MTQQSALFLKGATVTIDLPDAEDEVIPKVKWGAIDSFPTPAYWAFQVLARRIEGKQITYRLGNNLKEEVGACLLGGHGIPSNVGLAAYHHVRSQGAFGNEPPSEEQLIEWLSPPLNINGRLIRYRFVRQKSRYLALALEKLSNEVPMYKSGRGLRDWLLSFPGVGYKTASWITRNWLDADDVAILDIHILRAGLLAGFFSLDLTVERDYLELENSFLMFSKGLGVRPAELDAVIWLEMMSSTRSVQRALDVSGISKSSHNRRESTRAKQRHTNPSKIPLLA